MIKRYLISFVMLLIVVTSVQSAGITTAVGNGADTFISNDGQSGDYGPDSNHGSGTDVKVRTYDATRLKITLLRFDITGYEKFNNVSGAKLGLNVTYSKRTRTLGVFALVDETLDDWPELTTN